MVPNEKKRSNLLFSLVILGLFLCLLPAQAIAAKPPQPPNLAIDVLNGGILINIENSRNVDFEAFHPLRSSIVYINNRPSYLIDYTSDPAVKYTTETFTMDAQVKRCVFRHQPAIQIKNGDQVFIEWITRVDEKNIDRVLSNRVVWQQ